MVGNFKVRNPLTLEERRKIAHGLTLNMTYAQISEYVGRCKSVILREARRLGHPSSYNADLAQKNFESRQKLSGIKTGSQKYKEIAKKESLF